MESRDTYYSEFIKERYEGVTGLYFFDDRVFIIVRNNISLTKLINLFKHKNREIGDKYHYNVFIDKDRTYVITVDIYLFSLVYHSLRRKEGLDDDIRPTPFLRGRYGSN